MRLEDEINSAEPAYSNTVRLEIADLVARGVATPDEIAHWVEHRMSYAWLEGASFPVIENAYRGRLHLLVNRNDRFYSWLFVARDIMQAAQHRVEPTAPVVKRKNRKSTGTVSSKRRGGSR